MKLSEIFQQILFNIGGHDFTWAGLLGSFFSVLFVGFIYWLVSRKLLPKYFAREQVKTENRDKVRKSIFYMCILLALIGIIWSLNFDYILYENIRFTFKVTTILEALLIIQLASLLDWIISKFLMFNYLKSREAYLKGVDETPSEESEKAKIQSETHERRASKTVQYSVYVIAAILILQSFNLDLSLLTLGDLDFRLSGVFFAVLIFFLARLITWIITQLILHNYFQRNEVDHGSQYAVSQLLTYVIYIIAAFMILETVGVKMTVIWGGAAALLVGLGLGLQQTFNDLFSGILLLFERTVEVSDVVQIDDLVGTVIKIGLRTSLVETRDNVAVIVPNSKLVTDKVVNWSHADDKLRFNIGIGVAYGSDTQVVKKLLLQVAKESVYVLKSPAPNVRFKGFGDSSLDFELLFWSRNFIIIEDVKSDLRFEIDRLFRENNVEIPFPQRDVWIRK